MIGLRESQPYTNQESGVRLWSILQIKITLQLALMMTLSMSTKLMRLASILYTGQSLSFTLQLLLAWIGLETQSISEQLIKRTLKSTTTLKTANKCLMELQAWLTKLSGKLQHANWDGMFKVFTLKVLMELISTLLMPTQIELLLQQVMTLVVSASLDIQP